MLYVYVLILILELLIKYVYLKYSFDNVKVLINKEISQDFSGNIFSNPDSFFLHKANKDIIDNSKNIQHFPEILNNYNNFIFYNTFIIKNDKNIYEILPASYNNKIHLFFLEENFLNDFCSNELIFESNEKIIKILLLEKNTLAILFSNKNLILYELSCTFHTMRNLSLKPLENNNCFLDKIKLISPVKDIFKLTQAKHLFVTLDFHGKIDFYNLKNYFMSRYSKYDVIKSFQLGYYDQYFLAEIGFRHRFFLIGYNDRLCLIKIGSKINIKKIYFLNNENVKSLYTLDNYQILMGTDKGNLHLISVAKSQLNFDGVLPICNNNVNIEKISQEKFDKLICIKCGINFKLIDITGKFDEKDFDSKDKYIKEFLLVFIIFLFLLFIKIIKGKIIHFCKNNNNNEEYEYDY